MAGNHRTCDNHLNICLSQGPDQNVLAASVADNDHTRYSRVMGAVRAACH